MVSDRLKPFLNYLQFKMECAAYQEQNPIRLDYDACLKHIETLEKEQEERVEALKGIMPAVESVTHKNKPKVMFKKNGDLSANGEKWLALLREHKLPPTYNKPVPVVVGYDEPNPNSTDQVKSWLFSLGWEPCTYKYLRDKSTGKERKIEQVRKDGELTDSVLALKDKAPEVEILEGLTVIQHRLGIFKGFVECAVSRDGKWYLKAEVAGLTNTLRFKHKKPLVNLPGVDKPWGKEIRSCLMADEGEIFVGADMVSLEDTTKRHYIQPYDPEYVEEMSKEGFDPHLDLALHAGVVTEEEVEKHKSGEINLGPLRKSYKVVNYSAVYGVGASKLSRETGMSVKEAKKLLEDYWKRNWAVQYVAKKQKVKEVGGRMWLLNPVSGFWHELRYEKDRWSTTNQSTAVYVFDSWLVRARLYGWQGQLQFHAETGGSVANESQAIGALQKGVERLNADLTLNVPFAIDVNTGSNYADVH